MDVEVNGNELFDVFQVTYNIFNQDQAAMAVDVSSRGKRLIIKEALANEHYPHYAKV